MLAVILQDALNYKRALEICYRSIRKALLGQSNNDNGHPDHTNPIRHENEVIQLLNEHGMTSVEALSSKHWLSNVLAWMGTGQGFRTQAFLKKCQVFWASSLAEQMEVFQKFVDANAQAEKTGEEVLCLSDQKVWGQASNHLGLNPTVNKKLLTLSEKLAPHWTESVQEK
ncbi:hypothetical protein BKA70DRAFT_1230864 [Coprinopsis sp. MPI-PUGE-AT-0042]|nr:hypothetical protein BKA70DRAFT_1230864 [Coprinopsis sp. MPI-PUGE-AT-0042]